MSFTYATIGFGLGLAKVIENGEIYGTLGGISTAVSLTRAQKVWRILPALGDIAFAFPFSPLVLEIQDTLKSPPAESRTMKKATLIAIMITTSFYMLCGFLGYAAFGENAPGNLLTGFGFYEPYWLIDFANACIVVHLVGAYQMFCQPIFTFIEGWISHKWPNNMLISKRLGVNVPLFGFCNVNLFKLCWRTAFVVSTTGIAILFPLFNDVVGILGALNFWPLVVYFPVQMYIVQKRVQLWTLRWNLLQTLSFISLLVSVGTAVGSIEGLVKDNET
jgi:amino acid permease